MMLLYITAQIYQIIRELSLLSETMTLSPMSDCSPPRSSFKSLFSRNSPPAAGALCSSSWSFRAALAASFKRSYNSKIE